MRTSPVHYIAPSAISITPNCNNSANDLAVYIARNTKIKVKSEKIPALGPQNGEYQEWTLTGRNRRLADSNSPYTIYARLPKSNKDGGYLVFVKKTWHDNEWVDAYSCVTNDGNGYSILYTDNGMDVRIISPNYWYIRLGDVHLPENGARIVDLDTGILGTDQYNESWNIDPDSLPMRVDISNSKEAGVPYVLWGESITLNANLVQGWESDINDKVHHWTISRDTGDAAGDATWNAVDRSATFGQTGEITLRHIFGGIDDMNAAVAPVFTITAWAREENEEEEPTYTELAKADITILAETVAKYDLELSSAIVSYNPTTQAYSPADGVIIRVKCQAQDGSIFYADQAYITAAQLHLYYLPVNEVPGNDPVPELTFTNGVATLPTSAFADSKSKSLWLENGAQVELARETVGYVRYGEKGDTPITCYRWYKKGLTPLVPTDVTSEEPTPATGDATGAANVYPLNKWSKTVPTKPATGDWHLWMCESIHHGSGTIDAWNGPVRVSGDDGTPGTDAGDREYIYKGLATYPFSGTLPANINAGEVSPSGIADGTETNKQLNDWVPNGWSDTAIPTDDTTNKYVYVSIREKAAGVAPQQWGAFPTPVLWSNWGHQGIDGDGVQYIYKLFATKLTSAQEAANVPTNAEMDDTTKEWMPSSNDPTSVNYGWSDDPLSPTSAMPYCYCSVIKKINGEWNMNGQYGRFEQLGLWTCFTGSQQSYIQSLEAWSNDDTTASETTPPTTDYTAAEGQPGSAGNRKDLDWKDFTPLNTNDYAYLWRCSRKMVLQDDGSYDYEKESGVPTAAGTWRYTRLNGTNGTSIKTKGSIVVAIKSSDSWPTTGFSVNDLGIKQGDATIWKFNGTTWAETATESSDGDSYTVTKDCIIDLDGDGTSNNIKGHLIMWSEEANGRNGAWIDLGEFKGDPGTTYYTHIAWASAVTVGTTPSGHTTTGQTTTPNATAVTGFSIAPFTGAAWMGVLIDTVASDSTDGLAYTWNKVEGPQGPQGGKTATVYLYKRSATAVSTVGISSTLYYKFVTKKLYTDSACTTEATTQLNDWSLTIPSGTDPIYVTAAIAYSDTDNDDIGSNEWVAPVQFTENGEDGEHGINSATVFLYKRAASEPDDDDYNYMCPQHTLHYKFEDGELYTKSGTTYTKVNDGDAVLSGWKLKIPATNGNPCYVIQAVALSTGDYDPIEVETSGTTYTKKDWSSVRKMVEDGKSQPDYIQTQEAWSDVETVVSETTEPTPNGGWSDTTPANTNHYAYLWRRSRKMVIQNDGTYAAATGADGQWKYTRLSGTNGTSIKTKGTIVVAINSTDSWPTTGFSANDLGIKQGDATIWKFNGTSWAETSTESSDGDSYTVTKDCIIDLDGDGTSNNIKGHLILWSEEAAKWIDLGQFKGDAGTTYYTHVAWGKDVTLSSSTLPIPDGQTNRPNASAVTYFSISPSEGYNWMGLLINTTPEDPTSSDKLKYTWQNTEGQQGPSGGKTATVYLYKRSATSVSTVGISSTLYYKFSTKKLYTNSACTTEATTQLNSWSLTIPSGTNPIYITAAIAYSETETDNISSNEWVTPAQFTENGEDGQHGINSATVFLYKRSESAPTSSAVAPLQALYYKFADGKLYTTSAMTTEATTELNGWSLGIPATNGYPCYVIQAAALSADDHDAIAVNDWSGVRKIVEDGKGQPDYIQTQEAWSNIESVASEITEPTPNGGWSDTTPNNTYGYAYLWRRSRKMVLQSDGTYAVATGTDGLWKYTRLSGTNGTSIKTKGTIVVAIKSTDTWPTTGFSANDLGIKQGDATIWKFNGTTWAETATESDDGDSYTVTKDCIIDLDGDGTSNNIKGHLIMWSSEANKWIDLGQFKGDSGTTYYTHIAWASGVTIGTPPAHTPTQGQISVPNASAVETCSIAPFDGATHMGTLIDTVSGQDATNKFCYTWQKVQGAQGAPGGNTATVYLYKRSANPISTVGITTTLYYKFADKKLYTDSTCTTEATSSDLNGWSLTIPNNSTDPIYVTAAVAYSTTEYDDIKASQSESEWVTPAQFTDNGEAGAHGINSATVFLYKRSANAVTAHGITTQLYYKFSNGKLYTKSGNTYTLATNSDRNNWLLEIPTGDNPCYVIQAAALNTEDYDQIATTDWSGVKKLVEDGDNGIDAKDAEWVYIRTKNNIAPVIYDFEDDDPTQDPEDLYNNADYMSSNSSLHNEDDFLPVAYVGTGGEIEANEVAMGNNGQGIPGGWASHFGECTDDPKGVNATWPYEWEMKRTKGEANTHGQRTWLPYKGLMTIYNKLPNDGKNAWMADLDNRQDSVSCDKAGYPVQGQTVSTVISLLYGQECRTIKITSIKRNGSTDLGTGVTVSPTASAQTVYSTPKTLSVSYATMAQINKKDDFEITIQDGADSTVERKLHFIVNATVGNVYNLIPGVSVINRDSSKVPLIDEVAFTVEKRNGNVVTYITSIQDFRNENLTLYYQKEGEDTEHLVDDGSSGGYWDSDQTRNYVNYHDIELLYSYLDGVVYWKIKKGGVVMDSEDVGSVDNGTNGFSTKYQRRYKSTNSSTAPDVTQDNPANWSTQPTAISESARYRYMTERSSDDGGTTWGNWSTAVLEAYYSEDGTSIRIRGTAIAVHTSGGYPQDANLNDIVLKNGDYDSADTQYYAGSQQGWYEGMPSGSDVGLGDGLILASTGHLWILIDDSGVPGRWQDVGLIQGPKGDNGDDAVVYSLEPSNSCVNFRSNAGGDFSPSSFTITCKILKAVGSTETAVSIGTDGLYLWYEKVGAPTAPALYPQQGINGVRVSQTEALQSLYTVTAVRFILADVNTIPSLPDSLADHTIRELTVPVMCDGRRGSAGATGKMFYSMGEWDALTQYSITDLLIPMVHYDDGEYNEATGQGNYYYLNDGMTAQGSSQSPSNTTYWTKATSFGVVITQGLFAEFAKMGKAIMSGDYMFSMNGRIIPVSGDPIEKNAGASYTYGGLTRPAYTWFKGDPAAGPEKPYFEPNWWVDLLTGKMSAARGNFVVKPDGDVEMTGTIHATGGEFTGTIRAKNFYHRICIAERIVSGTTGDRYNVKYTIAAGLYIYDKNDFVADENVYDYVNADELALIKDGMVVDLTDTVTYPTLIDAYNAHLTFDGATPCVGDADEVFFITPNGSYSGNNIFLPPASTCYGKIISVYNKSFDSDTSINVKSADTNDYLSPVAYINNGEAAVDGPTGQSVQLLSNEWVKMMALSNGWLVVVKGNTGD